MSLLEQFPDLIHLQQLCHKRDTSLYLVGGYLRNMLLKRSSYDLDFTVECGAMALAKKFADRIRGALVVLDEEEGSARVVKKYKGQPVTYDFTNFRAATLRRDLNKRDFTINTLFLNLMRVKPGDDVHQHMKDYCGAQDDIQRKMIRMLEPSVLDDDPLRLMRAFTLKANYGFKLDVDTEAAIKARVKQIHLVSAERIRDELFKILHSSRATMTIRHMYRLGLLEAIMPQIHVMFGVHQGGYHHLDVWRHSLEVLNQFEKLARHFKDDAHLNAYFQTCISADRSRLALTKLGCLLHDIGKPETKQCIDGRMRFHGHEHVGKHIVSIIARQLKLGVKERHALEDMVAMHLRPGYLSNKKRPTERMYYRYLRDTQEEGVSIALLSLADQRGTRGPLTTEEKQVHHEKICWQVVERFFAKKKEKPFKPFVNGRDIMVTLGLAPSPQVGQILKAVHEAQALGKIRTKKDALVMVQKLGG